MALLRRSEPVARTRVRGQPQRAKSTSSSNNSRQQQSSEDLRAKNRNVAQIGVAVALATVGMAYASVPLYQLFCRVTGYGGTTQRAETVRELLVKEAEARGSTSGGDGAPLSAAELRRQRLVTIRFEASTSDDMPLNFRPCEKEIKVRIGETALAFFTARNDTERPLLGTAVYNVSPLKAGLVFFKIQCFCFDQQRFLPSDGEVSLPVFFLLSPEMADDPRMDDVDEVTLSYTFFPSEDEEVDASPPVANTATVEEQ